MPHDYARYYRYQVPSQRPRRIQEVSRVIAGAAIICGTIFAIQVYASTFDVSQKIDLGSDMSAEVDTMYQVDLTDPATANVAALTKGWYSTMQASVTAYTLKESCHNRKNGVCIMANGKAPVAGRSIACPRDLPLGTRVFVPNRGSYICEDRTAKWVQEKYGPTFDIFMNDQKAALEFGRQMLEVTTIIIYDTH